MDTRNLTLTNRMDRQIGRLLSGLQGPTLLTLHIVEDAFRQGNRRSTRCVELMDMMHLGHTYIVGRETIHDLGQIAIERKEDVHAHTEIGGIEKGLTLLLTLRLHLVEMRQPTGRTGNHRDVRFKATHVIAQCGSGSRELNRHIGTAECLTIEICCIINVYD